MTGVVPVCGEEDTGAVWVGSVTVGSVEVAVAPAAGDGVPPVPAPADVPVATALGDVVPPVFEPAVAPVVPSDPAGELTPLDGVEPAAAALAGIAMPSASSAHSVVRARLGGPEKADFCSGPMFAI